MNGVYVLSPDGVPLMPCSCVIARLLLKDGKAKVVRRTPFTIKLYTQPVNPSTQALTLGIDTGSSVMGSAVADENGNVLYLSEVEIRNDMAGLSKEHVFDATMIATRGIIPIFRTTTVLSKRCVPDGDYQQTKGIRSEQRIITGKIGGFRKFDKVRYLGQEYFIKGRMSTGYVILMELSGNKVALKPLPKFDKMKRVSARSSWVMRQKTMPSFSSSIT